MNERKKRLSTEDQAEKAETIRCLDIVDSIFSFYLDDSDSGFTHYMREIISKKLRGLPFYFRFIETRTSQIKRQYDVVYATYILPDY